jgi:glycosyltransferase involved in cell wall biosynthesis
MANALVSIITPTFNSEIFIIETIQSVQNQTYENWEMLEESI